MCVLLFAALSPPRTFRPSYLGLPCRHLFAAARFLKRLSDEYAFDVDNARVVALRWRPLNAAQALVLFQERRATFEVQAGALVRWASTDGAIRQRSLTLQPYVVPR